MQSLQLHKGFLRNEVLVPPSKSYANRALILAAVSKKSLILKNLPDASDVTILLNCLSSIGIKTEVSNNQIHIKNSFPECEVHDPAEIYVGEGGTTARFLACLPLLGSSRYTLILGERLEERPWKEFIDLATKLGAFASIEGAKLTIQGPIHCLSSLAVDCSKTTQFATGFQLLFPVTRMAINPLNLSSSLSYWEMTEKMVAEVPGSEQYDIPLDWSSASYPLAFAALNQTITFPGLFPDNFQADSKFYDLLKKFECIETTSSGTTVHKIKKHIPVSLDVSDCLDLVPTLIFFLSHIEGRHHLTGVENLMHKESDRLNEVIKLATLFERKITSDGKTISLEGSSKLIQNSMNLRMPDDHRMVMAGTLFLLHHSGGAISPKEAVAKSYPGFFDIISF